MTSPHTHDPAALLADQRWLAGLARGLVGNEQEVEDVLQETRLRVWRHPSPDPERAGGWLRRIATNVAHSMRSSEDARRAREVQSARPERTAATDELVARVEMQRSVAVAVLALAEPYRSVILLRFFDDLSPRVIAEQLGVPVETVRTRLKRGLAQLRRELDGHYGTRAAWSALLAPGIGWTGGAAAMGAGAKAAIGAAAIVVVGLGTWMARMTASGPDAPPPPLAASPDLLAPDEQRAHTVEPAADDAVRTNAAGEVTRVIADRARIFGTVFDGATQRPISGARATLAYRGPNSKLIGLEAITRDDGSFEAVATDVTRTFFSCTVAHPDYAVNDLEPLQRLGVGRQMQRNAKGELEGDAGAILMQRGTLVSGRVLRLPDRTPVAGAELFVLGRQNLTASLFGLDAARDAGRSRGDGTFELDQRVVAENSPLTIFAVSNGEIGFALALPERDQDRLDDFEIAIEPPGSLTVRVLDDGGTPVANVALTAQPTFLPFWLRDYGSTGPVLPVLRDERWIALFTRTTDASGEARFAALPEGRVDPLFKDQQGHTQSYLVHAVAAGWPAMHEGVLIERGVESKLDIRLKTARTWRVRGQVRGEDGRPIAGARVRVNGGAEALSDADGRYVTPLGTGGLGDIDLDVTAAGHAPDELRAMRSWVRSKMVTVDDGAVPCEVLEHDFTLAPAMTVRGRVVDGTGTPVANVVVKAEGLDQVEQRWISVAAVGGATGSDGRFVLEGVAFEGLTLELDPPSEYLRPFPARIVPSDTDLLVTLLKKPTGSSRVVAVIRDATTQELLEPESAYASELLNRDPRSRPGTCTPGRVVAEGLYPGRWELVVTMHDGRRGRTRFEVRRDGETVDSSVSIGSPGIVEGLLFDSKGERMKPPKDRWWVWVRPSTNGSGNSGHAIDADGRPVGGLTDGCARFDEDGRFRVGQLPSGVPIRFVVEGQDTYADVTVELASGETKRVEFHLTRVCDVQWQLSQALGPGQVVIATAYRDEPLVALATVPTGIVGTTLSRQKMPAGRVRWRAEFTSSTEYLPRVLVATGEAELAPGGPTIVDVIGFE